MRGCRLRFEFRVELSSEKPWMIFDFNYLNEIFLRIQATYDHSCLYEIIPVEIIEFISVTMTLTDPGTLISLMGSRIRHKDAWICTKPHCSTFIFSFLVRHYMDDRMHSFLVELSTVSFIEACHMPCIFNDCALHSKTYSKKRYLILSRILYGRYLTLNTPVSKPSRNNDTVN